MFSRFNKSIDPSYIISNQKGEPKAIILSDEMARDKDIQKILLARAKAKQTPSNKIRRRAKR